VFRHKFDPSSLIAGILFLAFAIRYLVSASGGDPIAYAWTMPTALGGIAVIVLLRLIFIRRRRDP
jgi:uncharacterized membrane protein YkvI